MRLQDDDRQSATEITMNSQLRILVEEYLKKNPYLSLNQLSQKSDVAFTSLRRLTQTDSQGDLSPHFVLNLSSFLLKEYNISHLIEKAKGPLKEFLSKHFSKFFSTSTSPEIKSQSSSATSKVSWNWVSLNSHYFLYIYLTKRPLGLNWNQLPDSWKLAFLDIHTLCLESHWVRMECKKNTIYWAEETLEIPESWKQKHEPLLLQFYEQTSELIEKSPIIEAEVSWSTFEKLSAILDRSNLECIKVIQAEMENEEVKEASPKLSIYLSTSLGVRAGGASEFFTSHPMSNLGKIGQSTPPELNG
ncbi:MAG: hypothetical protein QE271_01940 [Bacteriovoracaceae bacterium]|nr:hypothetical protein [Bacteriovoracaceae bacterium]